MDGSVAFLSGHPDDVAHGFAFKIQEIPFLSDVVFGSTARVQHRFDGTGFQLLGESGAAVKDDLVGRDVETLE